MKIKFLFTAFLFVAFLFSLLNLTIKQDSYNLVMSGLSSIEALASSESIFIPSDCRTARDCYSGGCGSSQCSISYGWPFWSNEVSVTAKDGYYACCWSEPINILKTGYYAQTFPDICCYK